MAVLPGRHPVLVAKQLASLSALAPKRVLPVFGLRSALPAERDLFVVPDGKRAAVFDESLKLLRIALRDDVVTFSGDFFSVSGVSVSPKPTPPLDVWVGGATTAAFRRIGALGDGWLGSLLTPAEAGQARREIIAAARGGGPRYRTRSLRNQSRGWHRGPACAGSGRDSQAPTRSRPGRARGGRLADVAPQAGRLHRCGPDQVRHPTGGRRRRLGLPGCFRHRTRSAAELGP